MAKTIKKITDSNVAVIENVEKRQVFAKKQLEEEKQGLEKRMSEIAELLNILNN